MTHGNLVSVDVKAEKLGTCIQEGMHLMGCGW